MFDTLSPTQRKIVFDKAGKFAVRACPGSGKTYSVAARLALQLESWREDYSGIATLSFTNTAWKRIAQEISEHFGTQRLLAHPHFLGTIDSFVNRYIFLPFGHLVMRCRERPVLVGPPHGQWSGRFYSERFFDNVSYNIDGDLYAVNPMLMHKNWKNNKRIPVAKERLIRAGFANQDDANYFGMKILQEFPRIAKALACRFPVLIVDEAQDTSAIQMAILDSLIAHGLDEIMLVGDPDQAIFEWNDAEPHLFTEKFEAWRESSIVLNENRRSSQALCDCTFRLSSLEEASVAVTEEVKDVDILPQVLTYDVNRIDNLITGFLDLCGRYQIEVKPENVAVAFRSKGMFCTIAGIKEVGPREMPWLDDDVCCRDLARGKYLYDNNNRARGLQLIERTVIKLILGSAYCSLSDMRKVWGEIGFAHFRERLCAFMEILPKTDCSIGEWVQKTKTLLNTGVIEPELAQVLSISSLSVRIKPGKGGHSFSELFSTDCAKVEDRDYRLGTIHSIKGETFEAILVILKKKGLGKFYKTLLKDNVSIADNEELRIVYVGLSRPRRLLVLAVPDEENRMAWQRKLLG